MSLDLHICPVGLQDVVGVTIGGFLGHGLCTALAVVGGRMIAQRISARTGEIRFNKWRSETIEALASMVNPISA